MGVAGCWPVCIGWPLLGFSSSLGGVLKGEILSRLPFFPGSKLKVGAVGVDGFDALLMGGGARFVGIGDVLAD